MPSTFDLLSGPCSTCRDLARNRGRSNSTEMEGRVSQPGRPKVIVDCNGSARLSAGAGDGKRNRSFTQGRDRAHQACKAFARRPRPSMRTCRRTPAAGD